MSALRVSTSFSDVVAPGAIGGVRPLLAAEYRKYRVNPGYFKYL
jgi:hypothetical protein